MEKQKCNGGGNLLRPITRLREKTVCTRARAMGLQSYADLSQLYDDNRSAVIPAILDWGVTRVPIEAG